MSADPPEGHRPRFRCLLLIALLLASGKVFALKVEVQVQGLTGPEEANVLALLGIYQERKEADLTEPRLQALHRLAPDQIRAALAPFGLYRVELKDSLTPPSAPGGAWTATYQVDPGPPVKITAVNYRIVGPGADNPAFPKEFPLKVGDVLRHGDYEKAKADLRYIASAQGYMDYDLVQHQVVVDPQTNEAVVNVELATGPLYHFGPVTFKQDLLSDDLLRRYVRIKPGDVYNPDRLVRMQSRLLGTEYYSKVEIVPQRDPKGESTTVPIEVIAERNKPNKFRVGFGFATDIGPRFSMDWKRRYLTSRGDNFRTLLSLSPVLSRFNFDYRVPIRDPRRDFLRINPDVTRYDTNTHTGWLALIHFGQSIVTEDGWRRDLGIDYRHEDYTIQGMPPAVVNELVPNLSLSKTVADDPINTGKGYRIKFSLLGAVAGVVSPVSYLSGSVDLKWVRRLSQNYRVLARTALGATWANNVQELPASRRFYAGGDNSIRGWSYDSLGPVNPATGDIVGGRYLAVGSLELERRIKGNWSASVFTDFGNAFDPAYKPQFEQSAGLGLGWLSPIGQVRLYLAFALTKGKGPGALGLPPARVHFIIGPDL